MESPNKQMDSSDKLGTYGVPAIIFTCLVCMGGIRYSFYKNNGPAFEVEKNLKDLMVQDSTLKQINENSTFLFANIMKETGIPPIIISTKTEQVEGGKTQIDTKAVFKKDTVLHRTLQKDVELPDGTGMTVEVYGTDRK